MDQRMSDQLTASDLSDLSDHPSTTTISTVAVQAGKAKIVLAILRSNEWIRVRIQQMEPDLMDVGTTLEEARHLRREHDELLMKLNLKQKDVTELLARADDLASQNKSYQEVYHAMAESLGEAWKDLNAQLEYRKLLLDQSIAFHESAQQFSSRMELAQTKFSHSGLAHDVETARSLLQQHQDMKKSILEASMHTLQEGQSLLERIREMGMHADVQNRHATTAACYGIEHLLELLHDRRRTLEELWLQRKIKLEQCLQLLLLDTEVKKVSDWFAKVGDVYLSKNDLGDSLPATQHLQEEHLHFEMQAREIQETVLRLVRTADQLVHSAHYDAEGIKKRLKVVDDKCEDFMNRLDTRRKNLAHAISFFAQAHTALTRLEEIERELTSTDLPRNSAALAERHAYLSNAIVEVSTPALRDGRNLLERVGRDDPGVQGISKVVSDLQERCTKLEEMCKARYEAGERSQAYNQFQDKFNAVNSWMGQIGQATLSHYRNMGTDLSGARDFLELHERLDMDMKAKRSEVESLSSVVAELAKSGDEESKTAEEKVKALKEQWILLHQLVQKRITLAKSYVNFHKDAQQLAIKLDALEQYLKIEKLDATQISDASIKHKEEKWGQMNSSFVQVEGKGKTFIKEAVEVKEDSKLDTRHAVTVVETLISHFSERKRTMTEYYENWKVHVSTGKEFKSQWHQFVQDARKTIDWVMRIEDDFFPVIAGELGGSMENVKHYQKQLDDFLPTVKKAQAEIEEHLKTAEILSLKGDTRGQKDQIVNELLKVHTRFQARITEYQVLLNMTIRFFKNLNQLDKLIEKTEKDYASQELPTELTKAELLLKEHEGNKNKMKELVTFTAEEGEQIVVRVRQQDSEAIAKDEVQKVLQMTESRRKMWEKSWEDQKVRLEQNLQVCQFYFDLRQLDGELDELHRQLQARRGNYGSSFSSVKMTSQAFKQFEMTVGLIEKKLQHFVSTADVMIRDKHYDSRRIRHEVDTIQKKWAAFYITIGDYRDALDESSIFFEQMDKCDSWIADASQFLLQIGRKATECKNSDDAIGLIKDIDNFRAEGIPPQEERLNNMAQIAATLYGQVQGPQKMQHVVDKNNDLMDSFAKAIEELAILRENMLKKENILAEMEAAAQARVEAAKQKDVPKFVKPLENADITEGQKFTFECQVGCESTPKIQWLKDDVLLDSPDYETSYKNGTATLTIAETFADDSAKYTCRATTPSGTSETSGVLKVKASTPTELMITADISLDAQATMPQGAIPQAQQESRHKVSAPDFSKHLKSCDAPEGTQFTFECQVTGIPSPNISWFKDNDCIDNSSEYVITKINGTCCLKIRRLTQGFTGRYTCKATNPGGEAASAARLNVITVKKPIFEAPLKNISVAEGKPAHMEVRFGGEPQPQIIWTRGDQQIVPSSVFKVTVQPNYTSLDINEVFPEDGGTYTVIAKNLGGESRTSCLLTIEGMFSASDADMAASDAEPTKPKFVQYLQNRTVMEGARTRLDCVVVAHPEPEIIWFHNDKPVKESKDFQLLFEGDRCSLIIKEVYLEDSGDYRCVARNVQGVAESRCRLIVEPLSELSDASVASVTSDVVAPKFTQLLKDMVEQSGSKVRFECRVIGHPTPEIKWFRERIEITPSNDFKISSQRELQTLTIPEVFREDSGNYMVQATNVAGEAKCYCTLSVQEGAEKHALKTRLVEYSHTVVKKVPTTPGIDHKPPEFNKLLNDMRARPGEPCRMEVEIVGNPKPKVIWLFNNEPVVSPDYQISAGANNRYTLYIPEVFDEDAGRFSVVAENESGKATCSALLVVVEESAAPPVPPTPPVKGPMKSFFGEPIRPTNVAPAHAGRPMQQKPMPSPFKKMDLTMELPVPPKFVRPLQNITAQEGTRVMFEGMVQGKPQPSIKWFKSGKEITSSPDFQITFKDGRVCLSIPEVFPEDAGLYEVNAHSTGGTAKSTAELVVKASMLPPEFQERLTTKAVHEGESVRFTIRVGGKPPPEVKWYREGAEIVSSPDFEIIQEGDLHSLYIPEVFYEDSGKFSVTAANPAGNQTCTAELIVEAPSAPEESVSPTPPVTRSPSVGQSPERPGQYVPPHAIPAPPQFTKPLKNVRARAGERVVLECTVSPFPEPEKVEWFRNEIQIHNSPDYQIKTHNGVCTLIIAEVFPEDSGKFTCTVTVSGVPNSTSMTLTVEAPPPQAPPMMPPSPRPVESKPFFQQTLTNLLLQHGQTAHFACKVQGFPPPEILWTRKGHPLVDKNRYKSTYDQYTGVTTLTILNANPDDEGEYTCTAINPLGEASTSATLMGPDKYNDWLRQQGPDRQKTPKSEVMSELAARLERPQASKRPADQFYRPMTERALDLNAEARLSDFEEPLSDSGFKVSHFEKRLNDEVAYREGRVQPAPVVSDTEAFDASFPIGQASIPVIEHAPNDFKLMEGSDATFVCKVNGVPRPHIQWFHNGRLLKPSNRYEMKLTKDGYATLRIRVAFPEDTGHYTVCATNLVGRDTASAELYVEGLSKIDDTSYVAPETLRKMQRAPDRKGPREKGGVSEKYFKPVFRKIPQDQEVQEGQMVRFDCIVTGRPAPELFWYRDGIQVHDDNLHKIVINEDGINSLIIHATHKSDNGQYTCIARNRGGEDQFQVRLNVIPRAEAEHPRFLSRMGNQTVREGQPVEFSADAVGVPTPMMSWQKDGKMISREDPHFIVDTSGGSSRLYIERAEPNDNAWYQCTAASIAGTASTRARLIVTVEHKREPERKLVIPKRSTPTPTQDMGHERQKPPTPSTASITLSPTPMAQPGAPVPMEVDGPWIEPDTQGGVQAPPPRGPPVQPAQTAMQPQTKPPGKPAPYDPKKSELLTYIQDQDKAQPQEITFDVDLGRPVERPPTQDLIRKGMESEPLPEDMYIRENMRPPKFKTQIRHLPKLVESEPAHFECRLVPIGDPDMKVEWFKDGRLLRAGHRFRPTFDFGYVALDILWVYPEDSGVYTCKATNKYGEDVTSAEIRCRGKRSVIEESQLPDGNESVNKIDRLEQLWSREKEPKERLEEEQEKCPPVFDLMPEPCQVEEGDTAKFMVKVGGHPRPRLTWWVNGAIIVTGHRFKLRYDGMIHILEIPKAREYDNGTIRVVAKNPLGEAECSTSMIVIPRDDWRSRLKQAPRSTVEVEIDKKKAVELRSYELDRALKKPKTTVVELRAMERSNLEKAQTYKDEEVTDATRAINLRHAQMKGRSTTGELRALDPSMHTDTDVHIRRAMYMVGLEGEGRGPEEAPRIPRSKVERKDPPTFTSPMKSVNVREGHAAKLEVNYSGYPTPQIQWFREGFEIQPSRDFQISVLANKSFLYIPEVFPEDSGTFTVRASNPYGMSECRANLNVSEEKEARKECPPEFRVQMHDITITIGEPATFDCQVIGYPRPEFHWTKDGKVLKDSARWKFIVEDDHFTLLIYEVRQEDQGVYECVVVNKLGKATCSARLTASGVPPSAKQAPGTPLAGQVAPKLLEPLKDQKVDEGNAATFKCKIAARPEPVVQWYYNNQIIKPSKYFQMKSGGGFYTLTIAGAFPEDEGTYKCTARNQAGEVTCIAHLKVNALSSEAEFDQHRMEPPRFTKPIGGLDVVEGNQARFEALVTGQPMPQVMWFREGHHIQHSEDFKMTKDGNKHSLQIKEVFPEDSGIFTCRATNPAGVAECSAELFVEDAMRVSKGGLTLQQPQQQVRQPQKGGALPPTILKAPSPIREVNAGNTTKLVVQIQAYPAPRFTWFVNGRQIKPSQRFKVSYDNGIITLIIFNLQPADSGDYLLKCANEAGEVTCKTHLDIKPTHKTVQVPQGTTDVTITSSARPGQGKEVTPTFIEPLQPEIRVKQNSVATLSCQVQAYPPPKISWHINGIEIKPSPKYTIGRQGEKTVLQIKNVQQADSGVYTCKAVSNIGEAVSSTTLYVTVTEPRADPPRFIVPLQNTIATDGQEVVLSCTVIGNPKPTLTWLHNDKNIDKSEDFVINFNPQTGKCDLVIVECLPDDQGVFKCIAQNPAGQAITKCQLVVNPKVSQAPAPPSASEDMIVPDEVDRAHAPPPRPVEPMDVDLQVTAPLPESKMPPAPTAPAVIEPTVVAQPSPRGSRGSIRGSMDKHIVEVTRRSTDVVMTEGVDRESIKTVTKKIVKKASGEPPRFTRPIQPQVVREGEDCTFEAAISGAPEPEITWLKDKKDFKLHDRCVTSFDAPTMTCKLTIKNCKPEDVGVYSCRASNTAGRATCTANVVVVPPGAEVTVTEKTTSVKKEKVTIVGEQETRSVESSPQFNQSLPPKTEVEEGQNATFECVLTAEPEPKVTWYKSGVELFPTQRVQIVFDKGLSKLSVLNTTPEDSGEYVCKAANPLGESTTRTVLTVRSKQQKPVPTQISQQPSQPMGQAPHTNGTVPPTQPGATQLAPDVPPAPMTEPCAVISAHMPYDVIRGVPQEEPPRFTMPLRDQTVNDGDKALMQVYFRGYPSPSITWFFNSQPIKPSNDFKINVDVQKGKSELVIVEVYPEDEGEYMVRAENPLGAAVTHCHLFVKLPSSSDEETEKFVSKTVQVLKTQEPYAIQQRTKFTEHIAIDHKGKPKPQTMEFRIIQPDKKPQKSEVWLRQAAPLKGVKMEVKVPQPTVLTETKAIALKKKAEALVTQRQEITMDIGQKHFTETVSIDHSDVPKEFEMQFRVPQQQKTTKKETSVISLQQQAALKGMKMEVEVQRQMQTSRMDLITTQRAEAVETQRQEVELMLEGSPPKFVTHLTPFKVMDGDEVKFRCIVTGNPMPEITWFHNDKVIVDNPDFRTSYELKSGQCTLLILEVFPQDTGLYKCYAVNKYGEDTTQATLEVEVYEYVPDSEEASQSQTESLLSGSSERQPISEDEIDFIERTEAFLANMRKLRNEITEEHEEEIVEMCEEFNEETIQMADVKWQIPQKAVTAEEVHEEGATVEFGVEIDSTTEQEIRVEYGKPNVTSRRLSHTRPLESKSAEETADELIAQASEATQQEKVELDLAEGTIVPKMVTRADQQIVKMAEELAEDIIGTAAEQTQDEEIKPDFVAASVEQKPETRTRTQEEQMQVELTEEFETAPAELPAEEEITVALDKAPEAKKTHVSRVQPTVEKVAEEDTMDLYAEPASEGQHEEIRTKVTDVAEVGKITETRVQQQIEKMQEEIFEELAPEKTEETQEEEITVELAKAAESSKKTASLVQPQLEHMTEEAFEELAPEKTEETQQEEITVELAPAPQTGKTTATMVQPQLEHMAEEGFEELAPEKTEETQQEEITVALDTAPEARKTQVSRVQPTVEKVVEEDIMDLYAEPASEGQHEEIKTKVTETAEVETKLESRVQAQLEHMTEEGFEEYVPESTEETQHEEIKQEVVDVAAVGTVPETLVQQQMEQLQEEVFEELAPETTEETKEEQIEFQLAAPAEVGDVPESRTTIVEERLSEGSAEDIRSLSPEMTREEEIVLELAQSTVESAKESRVGEVEEQLAPEMTEDVSALVSEQTKEEEIVVQLERKDAEAVLPTLVNTQLEQLAEESLGEMTERVPSPEHTDVEEIKVDLAKSEIKHKETTLVGHVEEKNPIAEVEGTVEELVEETTTEEEIRVDLSSSVVQGAAGAFVDVVQEHQDVEEGEEMFYEAPEPGVPGEEVVVKLEASKVKHKPAQQVGMQEMVTDIELTAEARAEFTKEEAEGQEIKVDLSKAEREAPKPSLVGTQEALVEAQAAGELKVEEITEEKTDETEVQVSLDTHATESAKPTLVGHVEEKTEVQQAKEDIAEYSEEFSDIEMIPSQVVQAVGTERPLSEVGVLASALRPEQVAEEYVNSIKEVVMIPSIVRPEYEPSVVERYRFETRVRPQDHVEHQEMEEEMSVEYHMHRQEASATKVQKGVLEKAEVEVTREVRAVQEVTEEQVVATETTREELEVVKKTETTVSTLEMVAPYFEIPLSDITVTDGEKAVFVCRVNGSPQPTITWYVDTHEIKMSADFQITYIDGVCTLTISDVLPEDEGEYSVKAVNEAGTFVTTAYLSVLPASRPESEPESPQKDVTEEVIFPEQQTRAETGFKQKVEEEFHKVEVDIATKKERTVKEVMVIAPEAPRFTRKLEHRDIFESMPVTLECRVTGSPEPVITWYKDGTEITVSQHITLEYIKGRCILSIDKVTTEDEAEYMCEARNEVGVATTMAELLIEKLVSAVEQVILEEFYEVSIELNFKWRAPKPLSEVPAIES